MTRKEFIALVAAGSAAPSLAGQSPPLAPSSSKTPPVIVPPAAPGPSALMAGPMLGHTGPAEARIWIRATAGVPWSVRVAESPSLEGAREVAGPALS